MRKVVTITLAVLLISGLLIPTLTAGDKSHPEIVKPYIPGSNDKNYVPTEPHGVMRPDAETRQEWAEMARTGSRAYIDPDIKPKRASYSLLSYLQYTPSERNQLSCGDCWVWAATGCMAIALNRQEGIKDRLSIQLLNSCCVTVDGYACCGGWAEYFSDWYNSLGYCIPWSNSNAHFQDANRQCSDGSSLVSCGSISTSTRYNINSCTSSYITTHGVSQATAIANIKNVLQQGKAIWFAFYVPTKADGDDFESFWNDYGEYTHYWNYDASCGNTWNNGWGHAVLCVGWYEDGAGTQYWEILNSWGTTSGRPNGIYLVKMDMNYDCQYWDSYYSRWDYMHSWATYDFDFGSSGGSDYRVLAGGDYNGNGTSI